MSVSHLPSKVDLSHCRCPKCGSLRIARVLRPANTVEVHDGNTWFTNAAHTRCNACGHIWNRTAHRGLRAGFVPEPKPSLHPAPGLLTRLFRRLFPHLFA